MKDVDISAMSYTSKDFGQLYNEVLDLAKELTNRWDPSQSNESDPGVVLLKEGAFLADHNNYNIDKNVLENFLPSATQDRSVRNIMEMNGYTPRYYVSAVGKVSFKWENPNAVVGEATSTSFTIPKFTMVISDADETISYTQVSDLSIAIDSDNPDKASLVATCDFMEGTKQTLNVNNSSVVLLENLDDNNRIYLPESMVAQNGIFIRYNDDTEHKKYGFWERNNYLLTQPSGSRLYKIDYDSQKDLPYIEFPSDISSIILSGLKIEYISTSGEKGNVSANTLVNILTPSEFIDTDGNTRSTEYLTLNNVSAISNGKDPETISEMYQSFKKVVGTFDTLVSCNDYSNKLYELEDNGESVISNCYVTDRRTEYNKALNVVCFDQKGAYLNNISLAKCALNLIGEKEDYSKLEPGNRGDMYYCLADYTVSGNTYPKGLYVNVSSTDVGNEWEHCTTINLNDFAILSSAMTPYDLSIYALKAFSMADYSSSFPYRALNNSFTPVSDETRSSLQDLELGYLGDSKCICHTFKDPSRGEVYCFKNYAPMTVTIIPYNKITEEDRDSILNKVYIELSKNFNPRNISFGEELDMSSIKEVIINSDDRIKDCNLEYKYVTYAMNSTKVSDTYEEKLLTSQLSGGSCILLLDLVTKNILAGRVCLFEFDNEFTYDYGQSSCKLINDVQSIITEVPLKLTPSSERSVTTSKTTQTTSTVNGSKGTISYNFMAPNFVNGEGTRRNVESGTSYTLKISADGKKVDTFKLQVTNGEKVTETVYTASNEVTYSFSLDDANLINTTKKKEFTSMTGNLTITEIKIDASDETGDVNLEYQLNENEYVQILYPNYYSEDTYGMYVSYRYMNSTGNPIKANTEHKLEGDEKVVLVYTKDGVTKQDILSSGDIVRTSFDLVVTDTLTSSGVKKSWTDDNGVYHENDVFRTLASNQTISSRVLLKTVLTSTNLRCYWITNSTRGEGYTIENRLFKSGVHEKILGNNEYFIYTNATMDEMMVLGAGTKLVRTDDNDDKWIISNDLTITIESITENGITSSIPWQSMDFSQNNFEITEMNVVTLSEGDSIKITGWDTLSKTTDEFINNKWRICGGSITYIADGETVILPKVSDFYQIRSRLDLICSPTTYQKLVYNDSSENYITPIQSISLVYDNGKTITVTSEEHNFKVQSSQILNLIGGDVMDLSIYRDNGLTIDMYFYCDDETILQGYVEYTEGGETKYKDLGESRAINVDVDSSLPYPQKYVYRYPFFYKNSSDWTREYLVPIYIDGNEVKITANMYKIQDGSEIPQKFIDYNTDGSASETKLLPGDTMYFLSPSGDDGKPLVTDDNGVQLELELTWTFTAEKTQMYNVETIIVDNLKVIKGINQKLSIYDGTGGKEGIITKTTLLDRINKIIAGSDKPSTKFYYAYEPDSSLEINLDKYLDYSVDAQGVVSYNMKAFDNPQIMWDVNNVANKMSIAQIDLVNSNIKIDSSMVV